MEPVEVPTRSEPPMLQQYPNALPAAAARVHNSKLQSDPDRPSRNERIRCNNCCSAVPPRQLLRSTLQLTRRHPLHHQRIHCNGYYITILLGLLLILKHDTVLFGRTMQPLGYVLTPILAELFTRQPANKFPSRRQRIWGMMTWLSCLDPGVC